jgi:hypothetical protein
MKRSASTDPKVTESAAMPFTRNSVYGITGSLGAPVDRLFYRIESERTMAILGFQMRQLQVDEGSGKQVLAHPRF